MNDLIGEDKTAVSLNLILNNRVAAFIRNIQETGFRINAQEARKVAHGRNKSHRGKLSADVIDAVEGNAVMASVGDIKISAVTCDVDAAGQDQTGISTVVGQCLGGLKRC